MNEAIRRAGASDIVPLLRTRPRRINPVDGLTCSAPVARRRAFRTGFCEYQATDDSFFDLFTMLREERTIP
jgi:hypothetical protein